jgi:hypothetical protein
VASSKVFRTVLAGAVVAAGAVISLVSGAAPAAADTTPTEIQPPAGSVLVDQYRVKIGYQVYRCAAGAWALKGPAAMLRNADTGRIIYHSAGPTWQSMTDGSFVTAVKRAESPVSGAIPQLLLEVTSHGGNAAGELSTVGFIQRLKTVGGLAPSGACVDGAEQPVEYSADYVFYAAPTV